MQCANILTGEISTTFSQGGGLTCRPRPAASPDAWSRLGWRRVVHVEEPAPGFRAERYEPEEIDSGTCWLRVVNQVSTSAEAAALAAADALAAQRLLEFGAGDWRGAFRSLAVWLYEGINPFAKRSAAPALLSRS